MMALVEGPRVGGELLFCCTGHLIALAVQVVLCVVPAFRVTAISLKTSWFGHIHESSADRTDGNNQQPQHEHTVENRGGKLLTEGKNCEMYKLSKTTQTVAGTQRVFTKTAGDQE